MFRAVFCEDQPALVCAWSPVGSQLRHRLLAENLFAFLGVLLFFAGRRRQGQAQDFVDEFDVVDVDVFQLLGRQVFDDVHAVLCRQDDVTDTCALGSENFLFHAADGQNVAAEGDFSGHGGQRTHRDDWSAARPARWSW